MSKVNDVVHVVFRTAGVGKDEAYVFRVNGDVTIEDLQKMQDDFRQDPKLPDYSHTYNVYCKAKLVDMGGGLGDNDIEYGWEFEVMYTLQAPKEGGDGGKQKEVPTS